MHSNPEILLSVHAEGPVADGGRLPLTELARITAGLQVTLERLALALTGTFVARGRPPAGCRRGRPPRSGRLPPGFCNYRHHPD